MGERSLVFLFSKCLSLFVSWSDLFGNKQLPKSQCLLMFFLLVLHVGICSDLCVSCLRYSVLLSSECMSLLIQEAAVIMVHADSHAMGRKKTESNLLAFNFFNVCLFFEREGELTLGRGRERGRDFSDRLCAVSAEPNAGLELTNLEIMT